jgi:WD40 repeat protein
MYHRGMKWEEYLEHQGFKDDIVNGLERQARDVVAAQAESTRSLDRGFGALIAGQQEMNAVLRDGFEAVSFGLDQIAEGIEALRADFDWAMGAVLWKLEMQQAVLRDILATLQAPLDTVAKELRRRAEDGYLNGWYAEALADFLESEQKNYQDFAVHQAIGNIYLYQQRPANLEKAREYYLKTGKYATPRSTYHAARGYLHAAFVCYLQRDDVAAVENARRATELYPRLTEAFFDLAKFAAAAGDAAVAIPALETAIRAERDYAIKARADVDFENIESSVAGLIKRLYAEMQQESAEVLEGVQVEMADYVLPDSFRERLNRELVEIERFLAGALTYFDARMARDKAARCRQMLERSSRELAVLSGHTHGVSAIAFSPDGATLASGSFDNTVRLWDVATGREQAVLSGHTSSVYDIAFSPDGATLASGSYDKTVRLWDVATGRERAVLSGHTHGVSAIAFSPDGATLASGSHDNTVRLWDVATGRERAVLKGHTNDVGAIAFSPDGATLASGSYDNTVRLWDVATGRERAVLKGHTSSVNHIAFSPDGATLASGSYDKTVRLWDVATGRERAVLSGHTDSVSAIAFSPDGATLASGSDDNTVRLWDVATGRERAVLKGHTNDVSAIAFSPDGGTLASGSRDNTVRLWGLAVRKTDWERSERERQKRERERQQQDWREDGRCEICGAPLGFLGFLGLRARCKKHR